MHDHVKNKNVNNPSHLYVMFIMFIIYLNSIKLNILMILSNNLNDQVIWNLNLIKMDYHLIIILFDQ